MHKQTLYITRKLKIEMEKDEILQILYIILSVL